MSAKDQDQSSAVSDAMSAAISAGTSGSATLADGGNVEQRFINSTVNVVAGDQILENEGVRNRISTEGEANDAHEGVWQTKNNDSLKNIRGVDSENLKRSSFSSTVLETEQGSAKSAKLAEEKIVAQTFESSIVNVVAGNQTIQHHHHEHSAPNKDISNENLLQICNENTMNVTAIDILDDFRHEKLQRPDFEVYPQMREVDVDDYYKGRYGHNQLTQEIGFLRSYTINMKNIGIEDIVESMWQKKKSGSSGSVGTTAIVASAGSGKSTLTRRIARRALGASPKIEHVEDLPPDGITMVHYIELKDVQVKSDITPSKFLFGGLFENEFEEDQAFKWLDKHQSEAVLIFDGLDQARWDFEEKNLRKMKKYEKASCWTVMYNILSRNILRHVNVYIASREFKVSELPAMARPEIIITLNGLTFEDAHRLFAFLLGENGEELWQKLETMSPRLLNLISVPVFLILTAVVMGRDPDKPPPTTVTELYNRIISALQSVENIRNREQILSIVNKLKALAFRGMREGRVVFKEMDLNEFGISAKEVQDLMTKVPGNNLLSRHLMQGNFTFFFCHQSLQEYLAAIFITEMNINEFSRFDEEHLHEERWSVVRRFVAGVVFSKSQNDLYQVSDETKKRQVFARSLRNRLKRNEYDMGRVRMELYTAICESDDDNLMKGLDVINVTGISMSRDEAQIVGLLAVRSESLRSLDLGECSIDDELLGIIARCLGNRIHVKEVNLRANTISSTALRSFLGHCRLESLSGNLDWNVVKLTAGGGWVDLKNGEDVIEICDVVQGHFNIKKSTLSFDRVDHVADVGFLGILFDAKFIEWDKQLLAKQDDLRKISDCKLQKIRKILLDCTEEDNIDWSLMGTYWKKHQMENLEIAVNGQIPVDDYNKRILDGSRAISVFSNIHAMFYFAMGHEFCNIFEACKQKKIEYIRCIFGRGCHASVDDISSLVKNSKLKKVTLIYRDEVDMLKEDEMTKAQKIANDIDTELQVLKLFREKDAWQLLDIAFYRR